MGKPLIRFMTESDIGQVVSVHKEAFHGFFLERMGSAFLRFYYRSILQYKMNIALVAEDESRRVVGFAAGYVDPNQFFCYFRAERRKAIPIIFFALLRRPSLISSIIRNTSRVHKDDPTPANTAELASIATINSGFGCGSLLLEDFCKHARERNARRVRLTTDEKDNDLVRNFYENRKFTLIKTEMRSDRSMCYYERILTDQNAL